MVGANDETGDMVTREPAAVGRDDDGTEDDEIQAAILRLVADRGADKTVCPSEVARALGGALPEDWRPLMPPIRRVAVRVAKAGRIAILRNGEPVADPDDFADAYRLGLPRAGGW